VLRAISMAGGFTKFGSSSKVRILRPRGDQPGYNNIRIKIKRVMVGDPEADMLLKSGDIIVISEGIF
ncbi:MAG: sugar transporter, partial [Candidatus Omnitrophica bacterium]|nr:sugar transporter [Candidatus Omnitrophota bacterium]